MKKDNNHNYYEFFFVSLASSHSPRTTTVPATKLLKSALPSPSASYKQAMQKNSKAAPNSMLPLPNALNQNNSSNSASNPGQAPLNKIYGHGNQAQSGQRSDRDNQTHSGPSNSR